MEHVLLDLGREAHGARIELLDHGRVGEITALLDGIGELQDGVDPVVDRAARDLEASRQIFIGGAQHAELARKLGIFGFVEGARKASFSVGMNRG
jgi:hypothetical protein